MARYGCDFLVCVPGAKQSDGTLFARHAWMSSRAINNQRPIEAASYCDDCSDSVRTESNELADAVIAMNY